MPVLQAWTQNQATKRQEQHYEDRQIRGEERRTQQEQNERSRQELVDSIRKQAAVDRAGAIARAKQAPETQFLVPELEGIGKATFQAEVPALTNAGMAALSGAQAARAIGQSDPRAGLEALQSAAPGVAQARTSLMQMRQTAPPGSVPPQGFQALFTEADLAAEQQDIPQQMATLGQQAQGQRVASAFLDASQQATMPLGTGQAQGEIGALQAKYNISQAQATNLHGVYQQGRMQNVVDLSIRTGEPQVALKSMAVLEAGGYSVSPALKQGFVTWAGIDKIRQQRDEVSQATARAYSLLGEGPGVATAFAKQANLPPEMVQSLDALEKAGLQSDAQWQKGVEAQLRQDSNDYREGRVGVVGYAEGRTTQMPYLDFMLQRRQDYEQIHQLTRGGETPVAGTPTLLPSHAAAGSAPQMTPQQEMQIVADQLQSKIALKATAPEKMAIVEEQIRGWRDAKATGDDILSALRVLANRPENEDIRDALLSINPYQPINVDAAVGQFFVKGAAAMGRVGIAAVKGANHGIDYMTKPEVFRPRVSIPDSTRAAVAR